MDLHVLRYPEPENHIFSKWSVSVINTTQKQKTSRMFKFDILCLYHIQVLFETFYNDQIKTLCTGAHKRITIH